MNSTSRFAVIRYVGLWLSRDEPSMGLRDGWRLTESERHAYRFDMAHPEVREMAEELRARFPGSKIEAIAEWG